MSPVFTYSIISSNAHLQHRQRLPAALHTRKTGLTMPSLDKNYHLKHRKQGDYFPDSPTKKIACDDSFSDEEKKDADFDGLYTIETHKFIDSRPPPYPTLPLFRGRCFLSEGVFPSDHFSNKSVYGDIIRIIGCLAVLFVAPLLLWDGYPRQWGFHTFLRHLELVWSSLLHISTWPITFITLGVVAICPMKDFSMLPAAFTKYIRSNHRCLAQLTSTMSTYHWKVAFLLSLLLTLCVSSQTFLQMAFPSLLWNPFMWGRYRVYLPKDITRSLVGGCFSNVNSRDSYGSPLCLNEHQWQELSSGTLSSLNSDDVETVIKGLDYLQNQSGGIIVNALARNVANSIPALRQNIEGLLPFLNGKDLSLIVFENDSNDGTREAFKQWAQEEAKGQSRFTIDLISCGESNPDCLLNVMDRYENMPSFRNPKASGVGKLGEFRQIVLDHILKTPAYINYSHMIVLDVDIGTSISPLGLLHTLGLNGAELSQKYVVASSSVQLWPGTFGTILPPYDFSAFRPLPTERNERLRKLHQSFCELMPAGDRWRNMCEAASPMQLFLVRSNNDASVNHGGRPYEVASAFNGLTLYPLQLIRDKGDLARYDAGEDSQRCEHVGFNLSLQDVMYINPKWRMNLKPSKPGGPSGVLVMKTILLTFFARMPVMTAVLFGNLVFFVIFVMSTWMLGISVKRLYSATCPRAADRCRDTQDDDTV